MADLLDVLGAWQSSQPKPAAPTLQGNPTTAENAYGPGEQGQFMGLKVTRSRYFPSPIELPASTTNDDPLKPGGADEILSVTQKAGATVSYTPVQVRTYPVRGKVI